MRCNVVRPFCGESRANRAALAVAACTAAVLGWPPGAQAVSGVVTDLALNPIAGAIVSLRAEPQRTTTLPDGSFDLPGVNDAGSVITAAAKGYFTGSTTISTPGNSLWIMLEAVPQDDDPTYDFVSPETCGGCHPDQYNEWAGSPMARGGVNPWTHDLYNGIGTPGGMGGFVYTRDSILAPLNPESDCASCHQPELWVATPFAAMLGPEDPSPTVTRGISCESCHKIADVDETRMNFPGIYPGVVAFTRPAAPSYHQVQYGMLGDSDFSTPTVMRSSHQPELATEVCGTCHQDTNDYDLDGDFEDAGSIISEPTYKEWEDSPYGDPSSEHYATCVDCHMPAMSHTRASNMLALDRDPSTIRSHDIRGTTPEYLENAARVAITPRLEAGVLHVDAVVTNHATGHHVPTGVTVRNMILLVDVVRQEDSSTLTSLGTQVVHDLGGVGDPADGYYAGLPGKIFTKLIHDVDGNAPTFFSDATGVVFDNRIPALQSDSSSYSFAVPPGDGTLQVRARLIYRRGFRALVDAKGWTHTGHEQPLEDLAPPHFGHLMHQATRTVVAVDCAGETAGSPCGDGDPCNGDEFCDGAGNCEAGTPLVCDDGNACTADACVAEAGCSSEAAPATSCLEGEASTLFVRGGTRDPRVRWNLKHGGTLDPSGLGNPDTDTPYTLCLYDEGTAGHRLVASLQTPAGSSWRSDKEGHWVYRDRAATSDGVAGLDVAAKEAGRSQAHLLARGEEVPLPVPFSPERMFEQGGTVVAQLLSGDPAETCWTTEFSPASTLRHRSDVFRARNR